MTRRIALACPLIAEAGRVEESCSGFVAAIQMLCRFCEPVLIGDGRFAVDGFKITFAPISNGRFATSAASFNLGDAEYSLHGFPPVQHAT